LVPDVQFMRIIFALLISVLAGLAKFEAVAADRPGKATLVIQRNGGDGSSDLAKAKSMDSNIGREFASYDVTECDR
jgi:hypothetical protein